MRIPIILGLVLLMSMLNVQAADNPAPTGRLPVEELMKNLDRNQNECIEEEEGRNYASRRFHSMDTNGDGQLDASEAPPPADDPTATRPIDVADWQDTYHARFGALDVDGSGCLSAEEITAGRARRDSAEGEN